MGSVRSATRRIRSSNVNFARDVVDSSPAGDMALIALSRAGSREEITFGQVGDRAARLATTLAAHGARRGDVVMTLIGNRPEWVYAMVACFRTGLVALPCTEQLRPADLTARMETVDPRVVVADERNLATIEATGFDGPVLTIPDERLFDADAAPAIELDATDPCLITFTSGTSGKPKPIRHGQRYLPGQAAQAEHWFGARSGDLAWCTAASGWSKSARNVFVAPWLQGATALLHDARFDPEE